VLSATAVPASLEAGLASSNANAGNTALDTQQKAAETKSVGEDIFDPAMAGLGAGLGQAAGGAIKGLLSCWIAAELYDGWQGPKTMLLRLWLRTVFGRRWYGWLLLRAYATWGESTAARMRTNRPLRRVFKWIFDALLAQAEEWLATADGRLAVQRNNRDPLSLPLILNREVAHGKR
jgi:hypothetical protein